VTSLTVPTRPLRPASWLVVPVACATAAAGGAATVLLPPVVLVAASAVVGLAVAVWRTPAVAAVAIVAVTPLVAGIDRGRLVPVLRPNEALVVFLVGVLTLRAVVRLPSGWRPHLRLGRLEAALLAMAVASSVLPLLTMVLRGREVTADDVSYALVLWKYLLVYAVVRASVRTDREIGWCLWAAVLSGCVVGAVGFLQAQDLLGVRGVLLTYWAPFGHEAALDQPRGGSTLALPAATADLLILVLAIAAGLWWKARRHGLLLGTVAVVGVLGVLSAAEFSSALGLLVAAGCVAFALRRPSLLKYVPVLVVGGALAVWPVIQHRLSGFQGTMGLPVSWTTRWTNLQTYFLPDLWSGWNPVLGVRPAARVPVASQGTGYVWIESGYVWLLWGGGVALLAAYVAVVVIGCRTTWGACRTLTTHASVAAVAGFTGLVTTAVLMVFDPHITYRGAADLQFALLALVAVSHLSGSSSAPTHDLVHTLVRRGTR
jgi:hypothetical protein